MRPLAPSFYRPVGFGQGTSRHAGRVLSYRKYNASQCCRHCHNASAEQTAGSIAGVQNCRKCNVLTAKHGHCDHPSERCRFWTYTKHCSGRPGQQYWALTDCDGRCSESALSAVGRSLCDRWRPLAHSTLMWQNLQTRSRIWNHRMLLVLRYVLKRSRSQYVLKQSRERVVFPKQSQSPPEKPDRTSCDHNDIDAVLIPCML